MAQLDSNVKAKVDEWLRWDKNEETRRTIENLKNAGSNEKLRKLMCDRLVFGTAGMRGAMGAGYNAMNDLVIIQTSQGLAKYVADTLPNAKSQGVVISYDARYNSSRFAKLAALAFLSLDIPVRLFSKITPTPFVPFTVVHDKCAAGIMVTASHNPKEDNGYKVYWDNGAQIISPHDKGIQRSIEENLEPWPNAWNVDSVASHKLYSDPYKMISDAYFKHMRSNVFDRCINEACGVTFTFTAMHGVSHEYMMRAFKECGFSHYAPVPEQMHPDPEFPTVKFPNPEEGKSALDLSFATANSVKSRVILANDPDADRLAVAEKLSNGEWKVFTGNETGGLLGWWLWYQYKQRNPQTDGSDVYMIASTVSSKILRSIANVEGFNFVETLTGFKWMANKAIELMEDGKTVLMAFEEAIGYMCGTAVLDKDGVSAAMQLAQLTAYLETKNMTLYDQLCSIYQNYGYHVSNNSYYLCYDPPTVTKIFHKIRNFNGPQTYPTSFGQYRVKHIRDLTVGYDTTRPDKKPILPVSASSEMITFYLENDSVITVRTSGTEPKIKYYSEFVGKPNMTKEEWPKMDAVLEEVIRAMVDVCLRPKENALIERSD